MNKLFLRRLVDGFIGALVLASGYVLVVIVISYSSALFPYSGSVIQKLFGMEQWTFSSTKNVFYAVTILGFILGCVFPQIIRKRFPPTTLGIPVILLLIGCFMYNYAGGVAAPHEIKLADCTNSITNVHFKAPPGRNYYLAFEQPNNLSGDVKVLDGANTVTNLPITSGQIAGWIYLRKNANYDLEITFNQTPPLKASVWLHWVQSHNESEK